MSFDRIIDFEQADKAAPGRDELGAVIEDYLGRAARRVYWDRDRWFAVLIGLKSWPLRRAYARYSKVLTTSARAHEIEAEPERWIEVWADKHTVDVLTRRQDEFTMAVADGLAALIARYYGGKLGSS